jgi:hypothetical protein
MMFSMEGDRGYKSGGRAQLWSQDRTGEAQASPATRQVVKKNTESKCFLLTMRFDRGKPSCDCK